MKKRSSRPFFKNKIAENRRKLQTNFHAQSSKTGILHTFTDIQGWEEVMNDFESKKNSQQVHLVSTLSFYQWLKDQEIDLASCCIPFEGGFRLANPKYGGLTVTGSIADGGRFNIGAAQMDPNFPALAKEGALYLASSEECARAEAAKPIGKHCLYEVSSKKALSLWDLAKAIKLLNYPNLLEEVKASHGEKIWAYQKLPTISQILASKLRSKGGAGIVFESTQLAGHNNIALFIDTDDQAKEILDSKIR